MKAKEELFTEEEIDAIEGDESIYSERVRDALLEDDELSPMEEAFMRGYEEAIS
ncbi:hypothetical protein J4212_05615 [Candidatus Woesearchaeota archaeon]|nr:hypothetical protein [Candidatus Woesearchaeota archaeon]